MNKIYCAEVSDTIDADKFKSLLSYVSEEKQKQINRFHFDIDKKLSLYSEILVRKMICATLHIANEKIIFEKNEYGKPYLKDYADFHFNLSHTRNAIVVGESENPVGVDIEQIKAADLKIAERFFTKSEIAYITKSDHNTNEPFYEIWTKKEAYIKYIGKGLSMPLQSFDVLNDDISRRIQSFQKSDYIISVCREYQDQMFELTECLENDIESMTTDH